jgi:hypothetical protein
MRRTCKLTFFIDCQETVRVSGMLAEWTRGYHFAKLRGVMLQANRQQPKA